MATHDGGGASEQHRPNKQRDKTERRPAGSPSEGPVNGPVPALPKTHKQAAAAPSAVSVTSLSPAQEDVINENLRMSEPGVNAPCGKKPSGCDWPPSFRARDVFAATFLLGERRPKKGEVSGDVAARGIAVLNSLCDSSVTIVNRFC